MTDRPLVLHVFATFGTGGPQVRAVQLMQRQGTRVRHAVLAMDGHHEAASGIGAEVACELLPAPARQGFLASMQSRRRLLRELRPGLVLTYNWGAIETVAALQGSGIPHVHHEDGFLPEESQRRLRRRNWARRWLLRGRPVVVPSLLLQGIAVREWRLAPSLVHHLPNGVDLQRFQPRARREGGPLVVGTVGGLRPEKDHATLLHAFGALPRDDVRLHLVGDGPLRAELGALAQRLGIADRVQFTGAVRDPSSHYHRFDVFVLSSRTEQMPLSMLEAMACGLPIVSTAVGDIPHLLPPECRAGLVAPGSPVELTDALQAILCDPQRMAEEGGRNRNHCARHYELGRCLDRYLALYAATRRARS